MVSLGASGQTASGPPWGRLQQVTFGGTQASAYPREGSGEQTHNLSRPGARGENLRRCRDDRCVVGRGAGRGPRGRGVASMGPD